MALSVLALALALAPAPQDREQEAAAELARGEELVAERRYPDAVRAFREVAEDFPETAAARVASPLGGASSR